LNTIFRSPESIFRPRSIAIVGASDSPGWANWSRVIHENLADAGIGIPVYPVNPRRDTVWGERAYPSLGQLPSVPDLALVIVPAPHVPAVLREGAAAGVKAAIVYASGFGEGEDGAGAELGDELRAIAAGGMRICGPNCMGGVSVHENMLLYPGNPVTRIRGLPAGDVGAVFQSGGTFQFWLQTGAMRGLGFSYGITSGSEFDLDLADYVDFMVSDERTAIICALVEGVRRPAAFVEAAGRALAAGKPLLVVKIGRSSGGSASAASHTGILAGDDAVFDAVCERYAIVRCDSLDDMIDTALVMRKRRIPPGGRAAMVTYSGGAKGLFLDQAATVGVEFAQLSAETLTTIAPLLDPGLAAGNPLDAGAMIPYDQPRFAALCSAIVNDPSVDILAIQGQLPSLAEDRQNPQPFADIAASTSKPVFAYSRTRQNLLEPGRAFQEKTGIAFIQGVPEANRTLRSVIDYGRRRRAYAPGASEPAGVAPVPGFDPAADLAPYGLTLPRSADVATADEAVAAARAIGYPVVLKALAAEIVHKTEFNAVRINLRDDDDVRKAATEIAAFCAARGIAIRFLVQEMVRGLEVLVGAREDAGFGPILVVGMGGIMAEMLDDVVIRLLPVDVADVREMVSKLRAARLFGDFRGAVARDVDALAAAAAGLGRYYLERRSWISDVEVNPLIVLEDGRGVCAVDVRIIKR
jgi:acyl-CoA synthetase (NDP forming)